MHPNLRKLAHSVAYLANKTGEGTLGVTRILALVYLADRLSIQRHCHPIQDDTWRQTGDGPVNAALLARLRQPCAQPDDWSGVLTDPIDGLVSVRAGIAPDDLDELSVSDERCLDATWVRFGGMDPQDLRTFLHEPDSLPEWQDRDGTGTPLPIVDIMRAVGLDNPEECAADHEGMARAHAILAACAASATTAPDRD